MSRTILSIAAGGVFGLAVAAVSTAISIRAMKKNSTNAILGVMIIRMGLDLLALGVVYLTRNHLPLLFEPTVIATAIALSTGAIALAVLVSRRKTHDETDRTGGE